MTSPNAQDIVDSFIHNVAQRLNPDLLEGSVRLDNTHTVVIIPVKGRGPIHAHLRQGVGDEGVDDVVNQLQAVPSLKGLVRQG